MASFDFDVTVDNNPNFNVEVTTAVGGAGSVANIDDVGDVTITSVADGELFVYDSGTGKWINQTLAEAGVSAVGHTHTATDVTDFDTEVSNNVTVVANTTHISSDGTDHTYIDQDVTSSATPAFAGINIDSNGYLRFEGAGSDTYIRYNTTTSKLELFVNGVKEMAWG